MNINRIVFPLKRLLPIFALLFIELFLFVINYKQGTFLVGWDNLYPELNFPANFERGLFAVWQEYRGLGLLDGMAHAANLQHTFFLWLLHFFLPLSILRYLFIFMMHFTGGAGMYLMLRRYFKKDNFASNMASFLGAIFYLFNIGTVQMFYAPLEAFAVHFAFLPWSGFYLSKFLESDNKKDFLGFLLVTLFMVPQGFIPQLFLVYLMFVLLVLVFHFISLKKINIGKTALVILTIFTINSYWLLPYVYSVPKNANIIINSKINQMSDENIYLKNKARGDLIDTIFIKGFMLDVQEYNSNGSNLYIMDQWRQFSNSPVFYLLATLLLMISILGAVDIFSKKMATYYPFLAVFFITFFFLASDVRGVSYLGDLLRNVSPLFKEAFRFSFTKFSILYFFSYTVLFSLGARRILGLTSKHPQKMIVEKELTLLFVALFFFYAHLSFQGNFLFDSIRLKLPQGYFDVINLFNQENKNARIATFPQQSFWSWRFNEWNYRGSGFLWYGVQQPMLDRAFDPWSDKNENYYWEMSYAVYSQNLELLEKVLEKYQIKWLLIDNSIINPSSPKSTYLDELKSMFASSRKIKLAKVFGTIDVYEVGLNFSPDNFVFLDSNLTSVGSTNKWNNFDAAFLENGNYVSNTTKDVYYPFRSLFTGKTQKDLEFEIEDNGNYFSFKKKVPELVGYHLEIPNLATNELLWVDPNNLAKTKKVSAEVSFNGREVEVRVPKIDGYYSASIDPLESVGKNSFSSSVLGCNSKDRGEIENKKVIIGGQEYLRLIAQDADNCSAGFWLPNLSQEYSYLITAETRNISGKSLLFWIENLNSHRSDLETYMSKNQNFETSYFIQPPMKNDGLGYTLHFDNISIGNDAVVNDLGKVSVYPIPYYLLTNLSLHPSDARRTIENPAQQETLISVNHPNPSFYDVKLAGGIQDNSTLILSQSYNEGWQAYSIKNSKILTLLVPILGERIKDHVLVNNWENGWTLKDTDKDKDKEIVIIFLPQYLEYLGFLLIIVYSGWLAWKYKHD